MLIALSVAVTGMLFQAFLAMRYAAQADHYEALAALRQAELRAVRAQLAKPRPSTQAQHRAAEDQKRDTTADLQRSAGAR